MSTSTPLAALVRGATRPSLAALLGTGLVAVGGALASAGLLRPERVARWDAGLLMNHPRDDYARLTVEALRLRHDAPEGLAVVVVGASDTREAIASAEALERDLAATSGRPRTVRLLTAGSLTLAEELAVLECLAAPPEAVVLTVGPSWLAPGLAAWQQRLDEDRLGFDAPWIEAQALRAGLRVPPRTGSYVRDHFRFFAARRSLLVRLVTGPVESPSHRFVGREPYAGLDRGEVLGRVAQHFADYERNGELQLGLLAGALAALRARGPVEVVLLEAPRNPDLVGPVVSPESVARYRERIEAFAREHGLHYVAPQEAARIDGADFFDHCHLRDPAAMQRFTAALAADLAPLLAP